MNRDPLGIEDDGNDVDAQINDSADEKRKREIEQGKSKKKIIIFLFFNLQHRRWCVRYTAFAWHGQVFGRVGR